MRLVFPLPIAIAIATLAACGKPPAAAPPAPVPTLEATVVDASGPVAGANVRLLSLPRDRCPCAAPPDVNEYDDAVPECACPQALARWRKRLAACESSARVVAEVRSDARGRVSLERRPGVTGIEVSAGDATQWLSWPQTREPIALALAPGKKPRVQIALANDDGTTRPLGNADAANLRGAVLFEDGHCVPLDRAGDAWTPRVVLPNDDGVLVVEARGFATIVYPVYQQQVELELHRDAPITGSCDGTTVRLDNAFQHLVAKVDSSKKFTFRGVVALSSKVTCWADVDTLVEEWDWTPGDTEPREKVYISGGYSSGPCEEVKVIDGAGRPVFGASVSFFSRGTGEGTGGETDKRGIACLDYLHDGGKLFIFAPSDVGGGCAGETSFTVEKHHLASGTPTVVLRITPVQRSTARTRGRVVAPDGTPIGGANVSVRNVIPAIQPDCTRDDGDSVVTDIDGTFTLSALPRGTLEVHVQHHWFAERTLTMKNDGSAHDIVLQRGDQWIGRVLDPEGAPIASCDIYLRLANDRLLTAQCMAGAFSFGTLPPGDATASVRVRNHPLGTWRELVRKVHFAGGKPHTEDLVFPGGKHISGRVVDLRGNGVANARLTALPKGVHGGQNRMHEDEVMLEVDHLGHFTLRHLKPGIWSIRGDRRTGRETTIEIAAGSTNVLLVIPDKK